MACSVGNSIKSDKISFWTVSARFYEVGRRLA